MREAKSKANAGYADTYKSASGYDVSPDIQPVLDKWMMRATDPNELPAIGRAIAKAVKTFQSNNGETVKDLRRFQDAKELLDVTIGNLVQSPVGRNRKLGGLLNEMQQELLGAADKIKANGVGEKFAKARGEYASDMKMKAAYEAGQKALRQDGEMTADQYAKLSPGEKVMMRQGLLAANEGAIAEKGRNLDVSKAFDSPRVQELLQAVLPPEKAERLGRFIQNEKVMFSSGNKALGNSATAERLADDEALTQMHSLLDQIRSTSSIKDAAFKVTQATIDRLLGFKADTAAAVAKQLIAANPKDLDRIFGQIERRLGPDRAAQFKRVIGAHYATLARQAAASTSPAASERSRQNDLFERRHGDLPPDPRPMQP